PPAPGARPAYRAGPAPSGDAVARAVAAAPGLQEASPAERAELERLLGEGMCAPDALRTVFGGINRQTLVSLIRGLGRC
ncbi:hypothetical protein JMJ94_21460, partial [Rhodovulum visakhapatnamense]|nr:hypothetical protein [Rhodovulum visakhapatnamense]